MISSLSRLIQNYEAYDKSCVRGEAELLYSAGILGVAEEQLKQATAESEVHIDFHTRMPFIPLQVANSRSDICIILTVPNLPQFDRMNEGLAAEPLSRLRTIGRQTYSTDPCSDMIRREYNMDPHDISEVRSALSPGITIINDHVRSANVIRKVLKNWKVDSASMYFIASSTTDRRERPYTFETRRKLSREEAQLRDDGVRRRASSAALDLATEYVKSDGKLIIGLLQEPVAGQRKFDHDLILGRHANKWVDDDSQRSILITYADGFTGEDAYLKTLVRNHTPYEEPGPLP